MTLIVPSDTGGLAGKNHFIPIRSELLKKLHGFTLGQIKDIIIARRFIHENERLRLTYSLELDNLLNGAWMMSRSMPSSTLPPSPPLPTNSVT